MDVTDLPGSSLTWSQPMLGNELLARIPEFRKEDWEAMDRYLHSWDKWRHDTPDGTDYTIYNLPLAIALLANAEATEKLNKRLLCLTVLLVIIAVLSLVAIYKQ
ncbi:MAG: hypothetical protein LUQ22_07650 [Methanotrichaceae archaeon]|nr:hypothetical protein [Methanotrichaceae archaeon]